jgi:flavin reductase (DIM6/NTAB) family NADH-FMN oxidoreductase RutF
VAIKHIDPNEITVQERYRLLQGGVAPRPIALVSTMSADGHPNLSPFSFFNAFGGNPPVVVFSPSRRQRDGSVKDTYNNLMATKECVIQAVTYEMVHQVSLASTEYPTGVNEFAKSGLTPIKSDIVKPFRVAESPFQMECKLVQMVHTGDGPGAGNLAVCEVLRFHVEDSLFTNGQIDPQKIDLVARHSADWYARASGDAIFFVKKPIDTRGVGYDQIPEYIRSSHTFSANNLGQLGNSEHIPTEADINDFAEKFPAISADEATLRRSQWSGDYRTMFQVARKIAELDTPRGADLIEQAARIALDRANDNSFAWRAAMFAQRIRTKQTI